jgi:hypothetical protein
LALGSGLIFGFGTAKAGFIEVNSKVDNSRAVVFIDSEIASYILFIGRVLILNARSTVLSIDKNGKMV